MSKIGLIALATTLMFTGASHAADEIALICSDVNGKDDYSLSIDLDRKLASFHMSDLPDVDGVTSQGELHLDGQVQGDVHCVVLVLGENAELEGNVVAEDVMVRGRLIGSVRAQKVMLQSTAHVEGNLVHKSLAVEHGTHFEGEFASLRKSASVQPRGSWGRTAAKPRRAL